MDNAMVEAMLQQAGLEDGFSEFFLHLECQSGTVLVDCSGPSQAERCVMHFNGCCWDPSGKAVTACVVWPDMRAHKTSAQASCRPAPKSDEPIKIVSSLELPSACGFAASPTLALVSQLAAANDVAKRAVLSEAKTGSVASTTECGSECEED